VLRRLGRAMRANDEPDEGWLQPSVTGIRSDPGGPRFDEEWPRMPARSGGLHEKLFYRPLLDAVARLPSEAARLSPAEARARLEALGYATRPGRSATSTRWTSGVSGARRSSARCCRLLLGWFADAAEPDAGLLAFPPGPARNSESSPWYLRLLRDETRRPSGWPACWRPAGTRRACCSRAPEAVRHLSPTTPS